MIREMIGTVGFVLLRRALELLGIRSAADAKDIEIAVLRHQLMVVRPAGCPAQVHAEGSSGAGDAGEAVAAGAVVGVLVTPATLLRWHRDLVRRRWTYPHRPGRRRRRQVTRPSVDRSALLGSSGQETSRRYHLNDDIASPPQLLL